MINPLDPNSIFQSLDAANEAFRAGMEAARPETCAWKDDCGWEPQCGGPSFEFNDDGPEENAFRFCPFCGGKLVVTPYEAAEEANAND